MDLIPVIVVQAVGLVATVATHAAISRGHEKRLDTVERLLLGIISHENRIQVLERCMEDLPSRYVPRTELQLMLTGISKTTEDTKALMQALVYGGGDRDVARKALRND